MSLRVSTRAPHRARVTDRSRPPRPLHRSVPRLVAAGVALSVLLTACLTDQELQGHDLVTKARRDNGLAALSVHPELQLKAHEWARYLASKGKLEHSELTAGISAPWVSLGETVSSAGSAEAAFAAQLKSPTHRAKLLASKFNHVGVGVAEAGGVTYFVVVLMQL